MLFSLRSVLTKKCEWNTGNHFVDGARRTAMGFAWCIDKVMNTYNFTVT